MGKVTIAGARVSAGYTQASLAEKLGVSRDLVAKWEAGKAEVKPHYLYAICQVTGFSVDDFLLPEKTTKSSDGGSI